MRELLGNSMYKLLGSTPEVSWLCSNGVATVTESTEDDEGKQEKARWRQKTRESAALSKSGLWGPTHSFSSEECNDSGFQEEKKFEIDVIETPQIKPSVTQNGSLQGTASTRSSNDSSPGSQRKTGSNMKAAIDGPIEPVPCTLGRVWNNLQCLEDRTLNSVTIPEEQAQDDIERGVEKQQANNFLDIIDEMCSPCRPKNLEEEFLEDDAPLGIARLAPPGSCTRPFGNTNNRTVIRSSVSRQSTSSIQDAKSTMTVETAADRRRQRHLRRQKDAARSNRITGESSTAQEADLEEAYEVTQDQVVLTQNESSGLLNRLIPVESLELNKQTAVELERSISGKSVIFFS
jgi:hypothetical protein